MQSQAQARFEQWRNAAGIDPATKRVLADYTPAQIQDCFHQELSFGTGGLRGLLGAGSNRMNLYTVGKATQGLAEYLLASGLPRRVAIAYDSRHQSEAFAWAVAEVLAASGITALLYRRLQPTPALSFAVRDQWCGAGVCITASHNPAQYNGYKVYGPDGCQITLAAAQQIQAAIQEVDIFTGVKRLQREAAMAAGLIALLGEDVLDRYLAAVRALSLHEGEALPPLSVVYTPLNGAGRECVTRLLQDMGLGDIHIVPEQEWPDGDFPTCPSPNPETQEALALGLRDCVRLQADLLLATDPDCDRVGAAVRHQGAYQRLTGNEVGVLLLDYLCRIRQARGSMPPRPVAITTVVSSLMADAVAQHHGVQLRRTLTGFKFIGEQIGLLEAAGEAQRYLFGFEESYGYLSGTHVRDKDGVNAVLLLCDMARWYKQQGLTLVDAMECLYAQFGYYLEDLVSFTFEGALGMAEMQALMARLRHKPPAELAGAPVAETLDYLRGAEGLPGTDMVAFTAADGSKVMVRPSGTEPKVKAYLFARGSTRAQAQERIQALKEWLGDAVGMGRQASGGRDLDIPPAGEGISRP